MRCRRPAAIPATARLGAKVGLAGPGWRNWQTRRSQTPLPARAWGFDSPFRHQLFSAPQPPEARLVRPCRGGGAGRRRSRGFRRRSRRGTGDRRAHAGHGAPIGIASRKKIERVKVGRLDHSEVSPIECGDHASANSLARGDDRSVDRTKGKVSVGCDQLRNSKPIGWGNVFGHQLARRQIAEEAHLGVRADSSPQQVGDLRDDQDRHQDWPRVVLKKSPAPAVLGIISVICRVQRSGVGDQWAANSDFRISSIRCETSFLPLRPAGPSRRLPPSTRCVSMAWRVSSDTVIPRRSAS